MWLELGVGVVVPAPPPVVESSFVPGVGVEKRGGGGGGAGEEGLEELGGGAGEPEMERNTPPRKLLLLDGGTPRPVSVGRDLAPVGTGVEGSVPKDEVGEV